MTQPRNKEWTLIGVGAHLIERKHSSQETYLLQEVRPWQRHAGRAFRIGRWHCKIDNRLWAGKPSLIWSKQRTKTEDWQGRRTQAMEALEQQNKTVSTKWVAFIWSTAAEARNHWSTRSGRRSSDLPYQISGRYSVGSSAFTGTNAMVPPRKRDSWGREGCHLFRRWCAHISRVASSLSL